MSYRALLRRFSCRSYPACVTRTFFAIVTPNSIASPQRFVNETVVRRRGVAMK